MKELEEPLNDYGYPHFLKNNLNRIVLNSIDRSILSILLEHATHPDIAQLIQEDYFKFTIACNNQRKKAINNAVVAAILENLDDSGISEETLENGTIVCHNEFFQRNHSNMQSMKTVFEKFSNVEQRMFDAFMQGDIKHANKLCDQIKECFGDLKSLKFNYLFESLKEYLKHSESLTSNQKIIQGNYESRLGLNRANNVSASTSPQFGY